MTTREDIEDRCRLLVDGCAVNRFALLNVDPTRELDSETFSIAITPDLEREYRRALDHLFVPPYVKTLLRRLLDAAQRLEPDGPIANAEPAPADPTLVALARQHLVITDDAKQYRRWASLRPGLIAWPEVEAHLRADRPLVDLLRERRRAIVRRQEAPEV